MLTNWTKIVLHFLMMIKFNHVQILNTAPKKLYVKFTSLLVFVLKLNIQLCFLKESLVKHTFWCMNLYGFYMYMQRTVIRTKSVEFMPFFLSLFCFLCGTSFFIFGLLGNDPFVYVSIFSQFLN